jgi:hypothetical protein
MEDNRVRMRRVRSAGSGEWRMNQMQAVDQDPSSRSRIFRQAIRFPFAGRGRKDRYHFLSTLGRPILHPNVRTPRMTGQGSMVENTQDATTGAWEGRESGGWADR